MFRNNNNKKSSFWDALFAPQKQRMTSHEMLETEPLRVWVKEYGITNDRAIKALYRLWFKHSEQQRQVGYGIAKREMYLNNKEI